MKSVSFYLIHVHGNKLKWKRRSCPQGSKVEADKTRKAVKNVQAKVEKATLGDLGALAEIKAKLKEEEKGGGEEAPKSE